MTLGISNNKYFAKQLAPSVATPVVSQPATQSNKSTTIRNTVIAVGGVSLLALAIFKGKSIVKALSKFFKCEAKEVKPKEPPKMEVPKIELPKPNFTCGEENAEQFAKEKASYIDSLRKEYINIDPEKEKEKSLLGLDALIKYGTREDMTKLPIEYGVSEDNDVMQKYSQLVRKVGIPYDSVGISSLLSETFSKNYTDATKKELMKTAKKLMVDDAPPGSLKNAEGTEYLQYKAYSKHPDPEMAEMATSIMNRIADDNPYMKTDSFLQG